MQVGRVVVEQARRRWHPGVARHRHGEGGRRAAGLRRVAGVVADHRAAGRAGRDRLQAGARGQRLRRRQRRHGGCSRRRARARDGPASHVLNRRQRRQLLEVRRLREGPRAEHRADDVGPGCPRERRHGEEPKRRGGLEQTRRRDAGRDREHGVEAGLVHAVAVRVGDVAPVRRARRRRQRPGVTSAVVLEVEGVHGLAARVPALGQRRGVGVLEVRERQTALAVGDERREGPRALLAQAVPGDHHRQSLVDGSGGVGGPGQVSPDGVRAVVPHDRLDVDVDTAVGVRRDQRLDTGPAGAVVGRVVAGAAGDRRCARSLAGVEVGRPHRQRAEGQCPHPLDLLVEHVAGLLVLLRQQGGLGAADEGERQGGEDRGGDGEGHDGFDEAEALVTARCAKREVLLWHAISFGVLRASLDSRSRVSSTSQPAGTPKGRTSRSAPSHVVGPTGRCRCKASAWPSGRRPAGRHRR